MARFLAGWAFAAVLVGNLWMLLAPIVARPLQPVTDKGLCPLIVVKHGVGRDLRTYTKAFDACGTQR